MKKTFSLKQPGKADARVLEAVINDVRKYVKRERRKALPEGVDFWDFDCKVGTDSATALGKHWEEVVPAIEAAAKTDAVQVYVEILAKPGVRTKKPVVVVGVPGGEVAADPVRGEGTPPPASEVRELN